LPDHGGVRHARHMGDEAETRWVTYSELGRARGISRASAERLARKKRWPRMKDNMGLARVAVPLAWLTADEAAPPVSPMTAPLKAPRATLCFRTGHSRPVLAH
jgi:hypothetical protein